MTRWTASALHAAISLLVIGTIAVGVVLLWFPAGLWHAASLQKLFGIMVAADVVLGPLLTLLVYRKGKPSLRFDLSMIVLAQAAFLAYGVYTLWLNRPVFLVGSQQAFALVFANEVREPALHEAEAKRWPLFHGRGPQLVGVDLSSPYVMEEAMFAFAVGGGGPLRDPKLFVDYNSVAAAVLEKSQPVPDRIDTGKQPREELRAKALLSIRAKPMVILLDARTGQPIRVVE